MQHTHGFSVPFEFPVHFTQDAWSQSNTVFFDVTSSTSSVGKSLIAGIASWR